METGTEIKTKNWNWN